MTLKTFWSVLIKLIGLYITWKILILLPSLIALIPFASNYGADPDRVILTCIFVLIGVAVIFLLALYCLFRTDGVIKTLRLVKGQEEERLDVNIHRSSLLTIALIVFGAYLLADTIPAFASQLISYFQVQQNVKFFKTPDAPYIIGSLLKIILGYFMIADTQFIVNLIERKRRKTAAKENADV